jgi:acyl-CoA synthetase (AMP-forming)/AMP-acid ligase II
VTIDLVGRQTVGAALLERAAQHPDKVALTMYRLSIETEHRSLTEAERTRRAGLGACAGVGRGTVRRTTSGKIRRRAMRELFLAGRIRALRSELDPDVRRLPAVDA